jgi:hypothetical protein
LFWFILLFWVDMRSPATIIYVLFFPQPLLYNPLVTWCCCFCTVVFEQLDKLIVIRCVLKVT